MSKTSHHLPLFLGLVILSSTTSSAQVERNWSMRSIHKFGSTCSIMEDLEGTTLADLTSAGWSLGAQVETQDDLTGVGTGTFVYAWTIGDAAMANATGYFPVPDDPPGNHALLVNDNADPCNCDMSSVDLTTPSIDLSGTTSNALHFRAYCDALPGVVQVSTDGGNQFVVVDTIPVLAGQWQQLVMDLSMFDGSADVRVRFHWSDGGNGTWSTGMALDDLCIGPLLTHDLSIERAYTSDPTQDLLDESVVSLEYTEIPLELAGPITVGARIRNNGTAACTNVVLTVNIAQDGMPLGGAMSSTPLGLIPPDSTVFLTIATGVVPDAPGTVSIAYSVQADEPDDDPSDDLAEREFHVSGPDLSDGSNVMARDEGGAAYFLDNGGAPFSVGEVFEIGTAGALVHGVGVAFGPMTLDHARVRVEIRDANLGSLASSTEQEVQGSLLNELGESNFQYFPLTEPLLLDATGDYYAIVRSVSSDTLVQVATSGSCEPFTALSTDENSTLTWLNRTPMIRTYFNGAVGIGGSDAIGGSALGASYPDPCDLTTTIPFRTVRSERTRILVTDMSGRVMMDVDLGIPTIGTHAIRLDMSGLSAGVYSYSLCTGTAVATRRMIVR
ncbi:MAG: T9SS type A sorting domain-containing protein [Flavobacteriales bacterium]|nr:T9SS type A sorting domain-containing protein [Flavobacteriales bacterium]MCB9193317.1 T9SS type A sorting domain-containing protein [Flavobacteriales bacterium]